MKIAIFLDNSETGGCIASAEVEVDDNADELDISHAIEDEITTWILGVGHTIKIEAVN